MRVWIGDTHLFFDVEGPKVVPAGSWMVERPTLLLVHPGPGFDHTVYKVRAGEVLGDFAQVVYLDQRGHGRSDRVPLEGLTLEQWADDIRVFCDTLAIERPVVLGHGFGAMVAAAYGARHPDHPAKLVLVNPAARIVTERSVEVYGRLGGEEAAEVIQRFRESPSEETFARFLRVCMPLVTNYELSAELSVRADWSPEALIHWHRDVAPTLDLRPLLAQIRVPTFVVAGEDDPEMTLEAAREFADSLPPELARFKSYAKARHAVFRDVSEAYNDIRAFVLEGTPWAGT
jgi:pimeloyl-ACP methyl ester carboxylesterase